MSEPIVVDSFGDGLMQSSPFKREWLVKGRNFGEGMVEMTVTPFDRYVGAQQLSHFPRAERGMSTNAESNLKDSAKRAKQQVRLRCKAIQADHMVTLTYRGAMTDKDRLKRDFRAFRERVARVLGFEYVAVPEKHKSGGWHLHIAVHGRQNIRVMRAIWWSIVGRAMGGVNVRSPYREKGLRHKLAAYIGKYVTKDFQEHKANEKRYWSSKGVVVPDAVLIEHQLVDDMLAAIKVAVAEAQRAGASMDRCQMFLDDKLGAFWLATRETS